MPVRTYTDLYGLVAPIRGVKIRWLFIKAKSQLIGVQFFSARF